ncbi:MAG: hypothetical protein ACRDSL_08990 [Pseudonocardiaceae bacterium]
MIAKLVLGIAAVTSDATDISVALYVSMDVLNVAFPPVAIGTIVSGVLLSLGTKWGLLQHYWVATKLVLTVGVIVTAVQIGDRFVRQSMSASPGLGKTWFGLRRTVRPVARTSGRDQSAHRPSASPAPSLSR